MPFLYHPFAVHFPIALLLTSAVFDVVYLFTRDRFYARAARLLIGIGLLGAAVAVILGFVDYTALVAADVGQALVDQHRPHSTFAYAGVATYLASFVLRWRRPDLNRAVVGIFLVLGAGLIAWATWLGSHIRKVM
ncbi:MAG: DUF2231 domain-containing protein [Armatimonadota bacterium]